MSNEKNQQINTNPELSVVILCYKAGNSIKDFVKKTIGVLEAGNIYNYELVLVSNYIKNSKDETPDIVSKIAGKNSKINFIAKPKEGMMGWDMKSGLNMSKGNYIAVIDGDGQMPIKDLIKVYNKIRNENLDLVKTYRLRRGDGLWRKILSFFYNLFFYILFPGLKSRDINSKPKIFTRNAYEKLNLESDDWFIDAEIMIQSRRLNFKIGEIPTTFLGLSGKRKSFVRFSAIIEFIKNLIIYRIKEFNRNKKI